MAYIDTHCHIHSSLFPNEPSETIERAKNAGVAQMICVGTDVNDSYTVVQFVEKHEDCFGSIGIHPHEASKEQDRINEIDEIYMKNKKKIVAIGEIGLDFYYNHSPKNEQLSVLEKQLEIAQKYSLPVIFHVRDAFEEFWPVFDSFSVTGVIHSFSSGRIELEDILKRELYVGLNGIMTFTKRVEQLDALSLIPLKRILLETDAPFLTPVPNRGKVNCPEFLVDTAEFVATKLGVSQQELEEATTKNAKKLFTI